jgi:uncharacterized membrane-anchored protein YitT (DUF2179 family)
VEIINTVVQRRDINQVIAITTSHDKDAFITVEEPKVLRGGMIAAHEWRLGGQLLRWKKGATQSS